MRKSRYLFDEFGGHLVFVFIITAVVCTLIVSRDGWVHPELVPIGERVATFDGGLGSLFRQLFDWRLFDFNLQRLRIVSDFFELVDAAVRPLVARLYANPSLNVSTILFATLVPFLAYRSTRWFGFRVGEALLAVVLLVASPGYLSDLFAYIRPAKPVSFILLAALVLWIARVPEKPGLRSLAVLAAILLTGLFTDELLYWSPFFVIIAVAAIGRFSALLRTAATVVVVIVAAALLLFWVLPFLYDWLGHDGPRTIYLRANSGEYPAARIAGYLVSPTFYWEAIGMAGRSLAAHFGALISGWPTKAVGTLALVIIVAALALTAHMWRSPLWRFTLLSALGFASFTAFGMWLQWIVVEGNAYEVTSLNYYYNSPVSLFAVLLIVSGLRGARLWAEARGITFAGSVQAAVAGLIALSSFVLFLQFNELVRDWHLGEIDADGLFDTLNAPGPVREPLPVLVVNDRARLTRIEDQFNRLGDGLFGHFWGPSHALYKDLQDKGAFDQAYLAQLCAAFVGAHPCPVTLEIAPSASETPAPQ